MIEFDLFVDGVESLELDVSGIESVESPLASPVIVRQMHNPPFEGDYEVTPGEEEITLQTQGLSMYHDVRINPIPSNYGRLTHSGGILRVW